MVRAWEDTYDEAQRRTEDTRRKMFTDSIKERVPSVDPALVFMTPSEVLRAMNENPLITGYHRKLKGYLHKGGRTALLYPDADRKPWTKGSTNALPYRNLYASIKNLKLEGVVSIFTLSPVLGVVPEEWYGEMPMYDASGLQSFMVRRRGLSWNVDDFRKVIAASASILSDFLVRNHDAFSSWHILYMTPSIHQRIFESAMEKHPLPVWPHPSRKSLSDSYLHVKELLKELSPKE